MSERRQQSRARSVAEETARGETRETTDEAEERTWVSGGGGMHGKAR